MSTNDRLTLAAAHLARTAPREWELFLEALANYTNDQVSTCIRSPLAELPRAQGRAQHALEIHGLMAGCLKSADKIERKY